MDLCGFIKKHGDGEGGGGVYWVLITSTDRAEYNFLLLLNIIQNGPILVFWGVFVLFF